jgi:hypothetical protein
MKCHGLRVNALSLVHSPLKAYSRTICTKRLKAGRWSNSCASSLSSLSSSRYFGKRRELVRRPHMYFWGELVECVLDSLVKYPRIVGRRASIMFLSLEQIAKLSTCSGIPYHVTRSPPSSRSSGQGRWLSVISASLYSSSSDDRCCLIVRSHARRSHGLLKSQNRSVGRSPRRVCEKSAANGVPAKTPSKQLGQILKLLHPFKVYQSSYFEVGVGRLQSGSGFSKSSLAGSLAGCSRRFSTLV